VRSRRYFWTIDALDTFSAALQESLKVFEKFTGAIRECSTFVQLMAQGNVTKKKHGHFWNEAEAAVAEANILFDRIKAIKERTITLRDGVRNLIIFLPQLQYIETGLLTTALQLFNASSVSESRASTRLGETVKLLTYVTIFYLPLAFCTVRKSLDNESFKLANEDCKTLWAVPNNFGGMHVFAIVITLVSLATYFVVFNLTHLIYYLVVLYQSIRRPLTNWMNSELDEEGNPSPWAERGRRFRRWKPAHPEPAPSEWLVLWYGVFCIARALKTIQASKVIAKVVYLADILNRVRKDVVRKLKRRCKINSRENPAWANGRTILIILITKLKILIYNNLIKTYIRRAHLSPLFSIT
jgi:hypothetical protein